MNKTITLTDEELQFLVEELGENRNRSQELLDEEIISIENDYLIKVMSKSIGEYDTFNQNLIKKIDFISLKSNIVLKEIKNTTILPLDDLEQ